MYAMKITCELGVIIVAVILVVVCIPTTLMFSATSTWAQTMTPGNHTSNKTMAGNTTGSNTTGSNTTGSMMKGNTTSAVPTPVGPPGP
jgi:hypothetical protein